jgi:hypothetical protein
VTARSKCIVNSFLFFQIRVLFGAKPITALNESSLYNIYCRAYDKAGFQCSFKQHAARRFMGIRQEQMG